jgi:superfamily II DNA or RNA helicase
MNFYLFSQIYPSLDDFINSQQNFQENLIKGEYENVAHYLQVHLPLLKEDFMSKLRNGVQQIKAMESITNIVKTPNVFIFPNVQIKAVNKFMWNMNCRMIVVKLNAPQKTTINWSRRFFNGQILCFSSSKEFNDLVIATIINREASDGPPEEINVEIVKMENISEIFDRDLLMIEPTTFFEPYYRVFNVLKNHNEVNFPFKSKILKLDKTKKFPSYQHQDSYNYNDFTFNVEKLDDWPTHNLLSLEVMQLKAIQAAVTSEFTIIQGPPGTGKTFVGLEILKILLENTNETILILTQTNNALDKFLIAALNFTESIVRMGGQSKCEELEKFIAKSETPLESKKYMKKLQAQKSDEISSHHRFIEEIHQLSAFCSINDKRVIGMTTTYAARSTSINKMLKPGIVIVEEASEVLESHVLVSLTRDTKQLIMIGDHQQLKPLTNSYELAKNFNFNVSLFERLVRNDFDFITLDVQMRMKLDICDLVRETIYKSLKDGANVAIYPAVKGMEKSLFCVNHSNPESVGDGETSKENLFEAEYIVELCDQLIVKGNDPAQITILTAYAAQAQRIKKLLIHSTVRVAVLDAYQGEESDIILLSLVRSNTRRDIGFLSNKNRIAVVLSRAKLGFYIVANMDCLSSASPVWRKIREILKEKQAIGSEIDLC